MPRWSSNPAAPPASSGGKQPNPPTHHFRGGERDVEEFGSEAERLGISGRARRRAGLSLRDRAPDYRKACSLISSSLKPVQCTGDGGGGGNHPTCQTFRRFSPATPPRWLPSSSGNPQGSGERRPRIRHVPCSRRPPLRLSDGEDGGGGESNRSRARSSRPRPQPSAKDRAIG